MKKMQDEYQDFLSEEVTFTPSQDLTHNIRTQVMADLNPSWIFVMLKLLFIHFFMGSLTLTICPQFGIGPVGGGQGILSFVEKYGHMVCGAFCGGFFIIGSVMVAYVLFSPAQKRKIYSSTIGTFSVLAVISLGALIFFSSMINASIPHLHFDFIAFWLIAGITISSLTTKVIMKPKTA